ncbi:hypothetical protein QF001_001209 [Paraburkholderia youngii]|uniref:hypothetical protein n=1 Tax=Paraburkholderia youngii TaxID=2782701 RepID=UPI003D218FC2
MGTLLDLARTGCPALRAARFYVDFRAYISIASLYQKTPVNSDFPDIAQLSFSN